MRGKVDKSEGDFGQRGIKAQELVDRYTGYALVEKIMSALDELQGTREPFASFTEETQRFLDQEVTATVWHGTRRKELIEELKKYGFCTYTDEQAVIWLGEGIRKLEEKTHVGPRISKQLAQRKARILYETRQPYRHKFSVTGIEETACGEDEPEKLMSGWAVRNPEFMWDMLWSPWRVKPRVVNEILTEMFGEPIKVKLKVKVKLRQLLGPQDIHLEQRCFSPEEIVSIEKCPPKLHRVVSKVFAMEQKYSLEQAKTMASEKGLPITGSKRDILRRLV